jgi:hypothetical protein
VPRLEKGKTLVLGLVRRQLHHQPTPVVFKTERR